MMVFLHYTENTLRFSVLMDLNITNLNITTGDDDVMMTSVERQCCGTVRHRRRHTRLHAALVRAHAHALHVVEMYSVTF